MTAGTCLLCRRRGAGRLCLGCRRSELTGPRCDALRYLPGPVFRRGRESGDGGMCDLPTVHWAVVDWLASAGPYRTELATVEDDAWVLTPAGEELAALIATEAVAA